LDTPQTTHAFRTLRSLLFFFLFFDCCETIQNPCSLFFFIFLSVSFLPFCPLSPPFVFQVKKLETKEWQFYLALA